MALSNILREPRREITETLIGIVVFSIVLGMDYLIACWLFSSSPKSVVWHDNVECVSAMLIGMILMGVGYVLLRWIHTIGENICNRLERSGVHLRPKQRFKVPPP